MGQIMATALEIFETESSNRRTPRVLANQVAPAQQQVVYDENGRPLYVAPFGLGDIADLFKTGAGIAGNVLGGVFGGPGGSLIGGGVASAGADWVVDTGGKIWDWVFGSDESDDVETRVGDLPAVPPGQAGGFPGFPGMPGTVPALPGTGDVGISGGSTVFNMPNGDIDYSAQGGDLVVAPTGNTLPANIVQTGLQIVKILASNPLLANLVQRKFDFHSGKEVRDPKQDLAWNKLAEQLPKAFQDALAQFMVGFDAPIGLDKTGSNVFLALMIAESGVAPGSLSCCQQLKA